MSRDTMVYCAPLATAAGLLHLFSTEGGLVSVWLPNGAAAPEARAAAEARLRRALGPIRVVDDEAPNRAALEQLAAYFAGEWRTFELSLDLRGTPFQGRVWQAVAAVPYGATRTYGEIAASIGQPDAVRAVGAANGANPLPIVIPCHRVVGAGGKLTGYGGGLPMKRYLLDLERAATGALPLPGLSAGLNG